MADDELDSLYCAAPDAFSALRTTLAAEAKRRGDAAAAKRISAARKPTTAAWIANRLALERKDTKKRLSDLGDRLRAAHAEMDGERIRDLSAEQHKLIDELTRAALEAADVKRPSASVREDLTGTLQAAVADPDVTRRLGRLTKPERWSGFGFGDAAPVSTPAKRPGTAAQRRLDKLKAAVTEAERAKAEAGDALSRRIAERDEARTALRDAQRRLERVEAAYDKAERADRAATESVKEAKAQLNRA
ncbi:hypothetical protein A5787_10270 [Mycobacterium sp. 852002-50816_SCH5313054-b]|uniref:hypothetical protein n=1 Tax=Mycobacterium sp. 852002-50816_SCH5313054-b TaxID=1834092 RepID=UPI0008016766|nr:hypothetical protein [Mycobacterium sp. 852002-50816_SCH5313054-b]OBF47494.1 hypothetical protein A5787_10270 [Mycobacterium sp. 852002-50816_SCH5313054-b]